MKVVGIASSSKGNAYLVEHGGAAVLVDCGVPYCMLRDFAFDAVLITHSHTDHVSGLKTLLNHRDLPVYANVATAETVAHDCEIDESAFVCFENGQAFPVGAFEARAFSIPHDTSDPVGYLLSADGETYFHGTDIGSPLDSVGRALAEATVATLESNHDLTLLFESARPQSLKSRICGPRGHLSNDQAAELVRRYASARLRELNLAHLSRDCNAPHLAEGVMKAALAELGREDVALRIFL